MGSLLLGGKAKHTKHSCWAMENSADGKSGQSDNTESDKAIQSVWHMGLHMTRRVAWHRERTASLQQLSDFCH